MHYYEKDRRRHLEFDKGDLVDMDVLIHQMNHVLKENGFTDDLPVTKNNDVLGNKIVFVQRISNDNENKS